MKKEYKIKGIEKILDKVSKKDLARFYDADENADFETLITESLKNFGVPNGLEIAGYEAINFNDMQTNFDGYIHDLSLKYIKNGKAAIGMNYPITKNDITELYFYIDEPIKNEDLYTMWAAKTHLGGVMTLGHTMGKGFYQAHKEEISKFEEETSKLWNNQQDFMHYVTNYFDILTGKKQPAEEKEDYHFDWERERAQKEKERMQGVEQLISKLTGGKTIEQVTLQDLEQIKQGLIDRQEKVKEAFAEKFDTKKFATNDKEKE